MKYSKEVKTGLIVLFAVAGSLVTFNVVKNKKLFSNDNYFYVKYQDVSGLTSSNLVYINGLKVGQVEEIKPVLDSKSKLSFVVKILVDQKYQISKNAKAEVFESGFIADKMVRIIENSAQNIAKPGDTISGAVQMAMMEKFGNELKPMAGDTKKVLGNLDATLMNANKLLDGQTQNEVHALLQNLNQVAVSLKETSNTSNQLLKNNEKQLAQLLLETQNTIKSAKVAIDEYGKLAKNIKTDEINSAVSKLGISADQLNKILSQLEAGQGSLGKLMKDETLYSNLTKSTNSLNELLTDLKQNPKRYVHFSVFGNKEKENTNNNEKK
jgi:phospholipid/cholesterol/gamma-HCH transport system substrate-binding protein